MKRSILIVLYLIACIAIGAAGDGLNNSGVQTWGHLLNAIEIAVLLFCAFAFKIMRWQDIVVLILSYTFMRAGLFDYLRNIAAGQPLFYMGGENWWDMFFVMFPSHGVMFAKAVFLMVGVALPIRERL